MSLASILLSLAVLLQVAEPNRPVPEAKEPQVMQYIVQDGDTIYVDNIQPAWVFPRGSKINRTAWRKYTRLVYNFNKVYVQYSLNVQLDVSLRDLQNTK